MKSGILRTAIATLRLRLDAPFPSQIATRQRYRMRAPRIVGRSPSRPLDIGIKRHHHDDSAVIEVRKNAKHPL